MRRDRPLRTSSPVDKMLPRSGLGSLKLASGIYFPIQATQMQD